MPYIKEEHRPKYEKNLTELEYILMAFTKEDMVGELNYIITTLVSKLLKRYPRKYWALSMFKGVLQDVVDEYKKEVMTPYENIKKAENGAVY